jgi:hypothetical protein
MGRLIAVLAAMVVLVSAVLAQEPARVVVPAVVMEDQFDKVHDVTQHRGHVVVLIYGDRQSADANKTLGEHLHVHFHPAAKGLPPAQARKAPVRPVPGAPEGMRSPDVLAIPIACVGQVPALVKGIIKGQFRRGSPDVAVWLDFQDLMKAQFLFKPGVPNVVVLDTQGRYRYAAAGQPTPQGLDQLFAMIEQMRQEAIAKK